jgi:hypothetical protein
MGQRGRCGGVGHLREALGIVTDAPSGRSRRRSGALPASSRTTAAAPSSHGGGRGGLRDEHEDLCVTSSSPSPDGGVARRAARASVAAATAAARSPGPDATLGRRMIAAVACVSWANVRVRASEAPRARPRRARGRPDHPRRTTGCSTCRRSCPGWGEDPAAPTYVRALCWPPRTRAARSSSVGGAAPTALVRARCGGVELERPRRSSGSRKRTCAPGLDRRGWADFGIARSSCRRSSPAGYLAARGSPSRRLRRGDDSWEGCASRSRPSWAPARVARLTRPRRPSRRASPTRIWSTPAPAHPHLALAPRGAAPPCDHRWSRRTSSEQLALADLGRRPDRARAARPGELFGAE